MRRLGRRRRWLQVAVTAVAVVVAGGSVAVAAGGGGTQAGPQSDGTGITPAGITPVGFRVTPVGTQTSLGDLPLAAALSPDGSLLLVSNDGDVTQSLQVVDTRTSQVVQTIPYEAPHGLFVGLAFSPNGRTAYASGGGENLIHVYAVSGGRLAESRPITLPARPGAGLFPAGLAVTPDGSRLVVADHLADSMSLVTLATGEVTTIPVGHAPWGVAVTPDGRTVFVSNQGDKTVSVVRLMTLRPSFEMTPPGPVVPRVMPVSWGTIAVGEHPAAVRLSPDGRRLFVACADSDEVDVVDTAGSTVSARIDLAPYPGAPVGSSPADLALSPDGGRLYVADAGNDDVAVVDLSGNRVIGLVPTAWYPTAVVATAGQLFVLSAKGLGAGPNTAGQYIGSMITGSLSTVPLPLSATVLADDTQRVATDDGFGQGQGTTGSAQGITHVIYVVQENRTYDQVMGSLSVGNGDPRLNLFGDESAANARALQRRFVTLDNFYADAEVSAQGWDWATQANSNLYKESMWPAAYSGRKAPAASDDPDPSIDVDPANTANRDPAHSFIWDRLADAGVSFRNYGFYVDEQPKHTFSAKDPRLDANTDHAYRGFDLACPDNPDTFAPLSTTCGTPRMTEWLREFQGYVSSGTLPTVEFVRLPNDHTAGTWPGYPTPRAYVADNDLALGRLVDAVSHSPYWSSTAIFVTEDDAQDGVDHVDGHRTVSQVISPYTQTGQVDSTFYSTASMLRSIENLVGIAPMTQFDAFAAPMSAAFSTQANTTPYTALRPLQATNLLNGIHAPLAAQAAKQPLQREDQIDEELFNLEIWQSVHGANSHPPGDR